MPGSTHNWHKFVLKTSHRNELKKELLSAGIDAKIHYPYTLNRLEILPEDDKTFSPVAEEVIKHLISLPIYPEMTGDEIDYVISKLKSFFYEAR